MRIKSILLILVFTFIFSCSNHKQESPKQKVDNIARTYVKLVLITGEYKKDYVDAYFGPEKIKVEAKKEKLSLQEIDKQTDSILNSIKKIDVSQFDASNKYRVKYLTRMIEALKSNVAILLGKKMSFDEESQALFDATAPSYPYEKYDNILNELDSIIHGKGDLAKRYIEYKKQFIIPPEKVDTVFRTAVNEGRRRTLLHIQMPKNESFKIEYVRNKSWGGYNWFKGNSFSLIQVNLDLPIYIDRAIDLACHEGYPGHHVYHSLIEQNFVKKNGWIEFTVYPLFSPEALLSEGSANFGIEVAFTHKERMEFEKNTLFPLAGINPDKVEEYYHILDLVKKLSYASVDIARQYLNGTISRDEAVKMIMKYKLRSKKHAEINVNFFEQYRSYIINYYIGEELCRNWVVAKGGTDDRPEKRWAIFKELLSRPFLPSDLIINK